MDTAQGPQRPNQRRHPRIPTGTHARLYWEGSDGRLRFAQAYCLDVSETGVCLQVSGDIPHRGASVHIQFEEYNFSEYCVVRHARSHGMIGAEFRFETAEKAKVDCWRTIVRAVKDQRPTEG